MWFRDLDGDGHGGPSQTALLCSPNPLDDQTDAQASGAIFARFVDANGVRYSSLGDDCCDSLNATGNQVFAGNTNPSLTPQTACANVLPFDFDCSGEEEDPDLLTTRAGVCGANCTGSLWLEPIPRCGETGPQLDCTIVDGTCTMVASANENLRVFL
jgi:hypothetical protein